MEQVMIRFFGLYLMTGNELMELDEKWIAMLPEFLNNQRAGFIAHEAPGKWKYTALPVPHEEGKPA
jgi:hypothetical protein